MSGRGGVASGPFDPAWFEELAAKEDAHFWFRARAGLIVRFLRTHAPAMRRFAEFGCGTGHVLGAVASAFPSAALIGSEYFDEALPFARSRVPRAEFVRLDLLDSPYEACFDAVGAFDVIEHIEDDAGALRSICRSLVPGGIAIVTVPQHDWLWSWQDECSMHCRRYSREGLRDKLRAAGLEPITEVSFVSLLLPVMLLSRRGRPGAAPDPMAEFRLHRSVNGALDAVMRAEAWLIGRGVRFPAGGSLLVVARRPSLSPGGNVPTSTPRQ